MDRQDSLTVAHRIFTNLTLRHIVVSQCMREPDPIAAAQHLLQTKVELAEHLVDGEPDSMVRHYLLQQSEDFWSDVAREVEARVQGPLSQPVSRLAPKPDRV